MMLSKFGIRFSLYKEVDMQLLPAALRRKVPPLHSSVEDPDPMVIARFYAPWNNWAWYVIEGERKGSNDFMFFGWVVGCEDDEIPLPSWEEVEKARRADGDYLTEAELDELAQEETLDWFSLSRLQALRGPDGQRITRDNTFTPCRLSEVRRMYAKGGIYEGQLFSQTPQK